MDIAKYVIPENVKRFLKKAHLYKKGVTMSFYCCGLKYSKNDPETYWCIDTYLNKIIQKKYIEKKKVLKEVVDCLTCKKNGCIKIQIFRYGTEKGKNILLEKEELSGKKASKYLADTISIREKQNQICPTKTVPIRKNNDFKYGKVLNSTTQRIRFLNEQGWAEKEKIHSPVKTYFIE